MNLKLPNLPAWVWVSLAALVGAGAVAADLAWPHQEAGPPLAARAGFYAAAGFGAAALVLASAWAARFLQDGAPGDP